MNQFYVSIIFLGITLISIALVWIAFDIKRSNDFEKRLDGKKEELVNIISDSEQMIEELNKFSDYIVTQMDLKNEEMNNILKTTEEKLKQLQLKISENVEVVIQKEKVANGRPVGIRTRPEATAYSYNNELVVDTLDMELVQSHGTVAISKPKSKVRDNVIPINSKHKEVLKMSNEGMTDTEIAKALNMGKGEIQLILGVNR